MVSLHPLPLENNIRLSDLYSKPPKLTVTGFPEDLKSFALFPKLAIGLRIKIWATQLGIRKHYI
jgi:hypothetical protein